MLTPLLESYIKERILLYLFVARESYPSELARIFGFNLNAVQYQLIKLEAGGVLYSKLRGKVRLFGFNPRYPFKQELTSLLKKAMTFLPEEEKDR